MSALEVLRTARRDRELASDSRAGSFARAKARRSQRSFVRTRVWPLGLIWLMLLTPTPTLWFFMPSEFLRGGLLGANVATATALVWMLVVQSTGTAPTMMGDEAEQRTARELRKLGRAWRLANHFTLSGGDIDHVLVGPAGVLVLETKWTATPWAGPSGLERQRRAAAQVRDSARRVRLWHEVKSTSLPVRAVVVLWGGETNDWPVTEHVRTIEGVDVVSGRSLRQWVRSLDAAPTGSTDAVEQAWRAVATHARRRDEAGHRVTVPRSATALLLWAVAYVVSATAGFSAVITAYSSTASYTWAVAMGVLIASAAGLVGRRWPTTRAVAGCCAVGSLLMAMLFGAMWGFGLGG